MAQLSKYVRERLQKKMIEIKKGLPLLRGREVFLFVVARAVKILKEEEARLKELAKDK